MPRDVRAYKVADKLRQVAADFFAGDETSDGLFLIGVSDAIEHGDAMDELDGLTLAIVPAQPKQ